MKPKKSNYDSFELINRFDKYEDIVNYIRSINVKFIRTQKKIAYGNVSCCVDIESSSFLDIDGKKTAIMYCFTFGFNGRSYFGRTYDELFELLQLVTNRFELNMNKRIIFYIHNLGYEFQFFYKRFSWWKIFAIKERTPLTATTTGGIEFRCSFLLSGYSLSKTSEQLHKYIVSKKVGDLDYKLIRHSKTPMNEKERGYVLNDGLVVMAYIQEFIERVGNITRIPLTKTGNVRKYCRDACLYGGGGSHKHSIKQYRLFRSIMNGCCISSVNEYKQLKRAFSGGFTHANGLIVNKCINNVDSFDFTSSYPYVMISEKFPMSRCELITIKDKDDFMKNLNCYCCIFDVTFEDLESTISYEHYISSSHCRNMVDYRLDNGRIVRAKKLSTTITEQDYFIIEKCYSWKKMKIVNFRRYRKGYLPTAFVKSVLKLYKDKTELKGIDGKEIEYLYSKELVNSCYGMMVTDICRVEFPFDLVGNEWKHREPITDEEIEDKLNKYNNSKQRFLFYPWGIWVTAYARRNLWNGIFEFKEDYLYSDTDSIKVINANKHEQYFINYNNHVIDKLKRAMDNHHISMDDVSPRSIDGEIHTIGLWDKETPKPYQCFKTLGAKR